MMDMNQQLDSIKQLLENQQIHLSHLVGYSQSPQVTMDEMADSMDENTLCSGSYFERIADIVNARRAANRKMVQVYERDRYNLKSFKDPGNKLTPEQEEEIRAFWSPYEFAYKNDPEIQRYYSGISGRFDATYIGFGLQYYCLNRFWNHITVALARNKNFLELVFPQVKLPRTIVRNMWARYYTADRKLITQTEAVEIVYQELRKPGTESLILKPDDGEEGKGILFLKHGASHAEIKNAFVEMKEKFICQEVIKNHPTYAAPNPKSLNTLRIATLFVRNEVRLVGVIWRMGIDKQVDNWSAGGLACGVSEDGACGSFATDYCGNRVKVHPSGFVYEGHHLHNCNAAVEKAKELHTTLPQLKYISWDFAIDEQGEPVLIEMNCCGGCNVLETNGFPCYIDKETLKKVLDEYLIDRFYYDRVNWNWNYQEYNDHVVITRYAGRALKVSVPATLRGKPVTGIMATAFKGKTLSEITVPQSVYSSCKKSLDTISKTYKVTTKNG